MLISLHAFQTRYKSNRWLGYALKTTIPRYNVIAIKRPKSSFYSTSAMALRTSLWQKFHAAFLQSAPTEYIDETNGKQFKDDESYHLWETICKRLGTTALKAPIQSTYEDRDCHFDVRASLVLEESRQAIADGLEDWINNPSKVPSLQIEIVESKRFPSYAERSLLKHKKMEINRRNEPKLRPSTILACVKQGDSPTLSNARLVAVIPSQSYDPHSNHFRIMDCTYRHEDNNNMTWNCFEIAGLLTEHRKFEACTIPESRRVPFIRALQLGHQKDQIGEGAHTEKSIQTRDDKGSIIGTNRLNDLQEKAASDFLSSDPGAVTVIQGPPGTGKTALLVSIICRHLLESKKMGERRRLIVCAPTNKAITVVCERFLSVMRLNDNFDVQALLIGDDDKIMDGEKAKGFGGPHDLQSVFMYTWTRTIADGYSQLLMAIKKTSKKVKADELVKLSGELQKRLDKVPEGFLLKSSTSEINKILAIRKKSERKKSKTNLIYLLKDVVESIHQMSSKDVFKSLIKSSDVIFSTLSSAGISALKKSAITVHDLIVDEAAASTEPELYIPFHLHPKRLLVIGDPRQLPPTVMSRRATTLKLSMSLHERLMDHNKWKPVMLTKQYRMKPEIRQFPSEAFYDGQLKDGENVERLLREKFALGRKCIYLLEGEETRTKSGSLQNKEEALAVVSLVEQLRKKALKMGDTNWYHVDRLRIITFYQSQVALIENLLRSRGFKNIVVATVDSSQGSEAEIVIVSFVRSKGSKSNGVGFLSDNRRLNVAMTRAKYQLVAVGNFERMKNLDSKSATTVRQLVVDAADRESIHNNTPSKARKE